MSHNRVVRVAGVSKSYASVAGPVPALVSVDLDVALNECVAVVGPSGSGKSTLLGIIGGLTDPSTHRCIEVAGVDWTTLDERQRSRVRRERIGFVHQGLNLVSFLSVVENVSLPQIVNRTPRRAADDRSRAALSALGLADVVDRLPEELSGGQQQRVAVARVLAAGQSLLLADEPTGALDTASSRVVFEAIRHHSRTRGGAVVVSHDPLVRDYVDRTVEIVDGTVRA